jgi:ribosome biogenesis GTPase A
MTTIPKVDTSNIFTITEKGDRKILESHSRAIILVGLTRVGKSTVYNWILKKPMVGMGNLNSYYVPQIENDIDSGQVGNSLASVTLIPNIHKDL